MAGHRRSRDAAAAWARRIERMRAARFERQQRARTPNERIVVAADHLRAVLTHFATPEQAQRVADAAVDGLISQAEDLLTARERGHAP